jgi:hypothetical protein
VRVNCSEGQGTWVLVGKVFDRKKTLGLQKMSTIIMRAGERRYSNFELVPKPETHQAQQRRVSSSKELFAPIIMDEEQSIFSRLKTVMIPVLVFLIFLVIHDYLFYLMITSGQCRR